MTPRQREALRSLSRCPFVRSVPDAGWIATDGTKEKISTKVFQRLYGTRFIRTLGPSIRPRAAFITVAGKKALEAA